MKPAARLTSGLLLGLLAATLVLGLGEASLRIAGRLRHGAWPHTRAAVFYDQILLLRKIYRGHAYLNTAPHEGGTVSAFGKSVALDRHGYRSPERPLAKPQGVIRILAAGGSTTFDISAPDNAGTWPSLLEKRLGPRVEVWNAGFPGWTSQENLIALAIRDLDLAPDLVILSQGINDLQPASHEPFDPQYETGHAELTHRALGLELPPPSWPARSVLLEKLGDALRGPSDPWTALAEPSTGKPRRERIGPGGLAAFERNVRSIVALAGSRGTRVLLVTQPIRIRATHREADLAYLADWYPELMPEAAPGQLERLNDVVRKLAAEGLGPLADPVRDIRWEDQDFSDPLHTGESGRRKLVDFLTPRVGAAMAP
jgi:lysophospholipase L1-like esterase